MSLRALRLIHSSLSVKKIKVADFQISEELLSSCNHASNRYRMFLMEKKIEKEHAVRGKNERLWRKNLDQQRSRKKSWKVLLRSWLTQLIRKLNRLRSKWMLLKWKLYLWNQIIPERNLSKLQKRHANSREGNTVPRKKQLKELDLLGCTCQGYASVAKCSIVYICTVI